MARKMLIDARLPEETRLAIVDGKNVEEFDIESRTRKPLKGNVYLAKVVRVEPSLQAVFVDYGGNRHGFLSFSEIHPDYYQIPVEDRQALLKAQAEADEAAAKEAEARADARAKAATKAKAAEDSDSPDGDAADADADGGGDGHDPAFDSDGPDGEEGRRRRPQVAARRYNVQEVIKRRQIILVQVVKEERGTKGAALTAYLSLAGRYCVLMTNTCRGGGISRRITQASDRKKLKETVDSLELPKGMGLIVRTAGAKRTKAEIKRDCDYLLRLWDTIREKTMESSAPALVHEEGNLIKRAIRDLYDKSIDAIHIEGEDGYREAKDFMKMLMPSHTKNVQLDKENEPLFQRYGIEPQLAAILDPVVQLKSGGYLVINPTEALISIDVNSGRATREHNIEDTALKTNMEAAVEVARQIRLRDLAGLIVIDFIDMEEGRNNRSVERKLQDSLKSDRARIQMGRISLFGLLEMSRQRMRSSLLESNTESCPHCNGSGIVRSADSAAMEILRRIESEAPDGQTAALTVRTGSELALHIFNALRSELASIQERTGIAITIEPDGPATGRAFSIEETKEPDPEANGAGASRDRRPERPERQERQERSERKERSPRARRSASSSRARARPPAEAETEAEPEAPERNGGEESADAEPRRRRVRRTRGGRRHRGAAAKDSSAPPPQ